MPTKIKREQSLLIPFKDGLSISDSQNKPRVYLTRKAFEKSFPGHLIDKEGVELVEYVEVVRCKYCIFWKPRHIKLNDGSEREYLPGEDLVEVSVGINVGSKCLVDQGRGYGCDKSVFRKEDDFCSKGLRKMDAEVEG